MRGPYQRQTRSGSRRNASIEATSNGSTSAQSPAAERKSGMPLSVLIPAPVRTTAGPRVAGSGRRARARCSHAAHRRGEIVSRPAHGRFRFAHDVRVRFAETDAQGIAHHASFVVWLEEARVAYLARVRGRLPGDPRARHRGAHDGRPPRVRARRRLRRRAHGLGRAARRSAARGSATSTSSSARTSSSRRAGRRTRPSTQPRTGRSACPTGSSRTSSGPRRRSSSTPSPLAGGYAVDRAGFAARRPSPSAPPASAAASSRRGRSSAHPRSRSARSCRRAACRRRRRPCAVTLSSAAALRSARSTFACRRAASGPVDPLDRDLPVDLERCRLRLDAAAGRRAVEVHRERAGADERAHEQPFVRVVREHEVEVGVVHRRVAAERVVADVERVVRPPLDREARLEGGVEHRRRDLADAPADPGLQLAVDDHRRLLEPLRRVPLARRLVEGEPSAGGDQRPVDQLGDELHVVDAPGRAAVRRRVRADDARDPHRLRVGGRPSGSGCASRAARSGPGGRRERGALDREPRGCLDVQRAAGTRRDDLDPAGHRP